MRDKEERNN